MRDLDSVVDLKRRLLEEEPAVRIELAAELIGMSERSLRRRLHQFEYRRNHRHIWITLRSIAKFIAD
jgi:hypothetical protein